MEEKKRGFKPTLETKLTREDFNRVDAMAKAEGRTKSEIMREALLWYLDHKASAPCWPDKAARSVRYTNLRI